MNESEATVALDQGDTMREISGPRLVYLERCAAAVEWVEKSSAIPTRYNDYLTRKACWVIRRNGCFEGPTWLATVELAMKGTP